jgi:hypothetical protein
MVPYHECLDRFRMKLHEKYNDSIKASLESVTFRTSLQVFALKRSVASALFPEFESEEWFEALVERMWEDSYIVKDDGHDLVFPQAFAASRFRELERQRWFRR